MEDNNWGRCPTGNTKNGNWHRVLVAMERIVVVFLRIQRMSIKQAASIGFRSNGATRCLQNFGENFRRMALMNSFYFVTERSFTGEAPTGGVKTTPQKTRFRDVKVCNTLGYRLSGRWQDTIGLQHLEGRILHLVLRVRGEMQLAKNHLAGRWGVRHQWRRENQDPENQHEAQHEHVSVRVVLQSP